MRPLHHWVWSDADRRLRKLLTFAEVETDGGRDILRAAEVTPDPLLRRLYLEHAIDELHHGDLFRDRGAALLRTRRGTRKVLLDAIRCRAATASTTWRSRASRTTGCWRFYTLPRSQPPAALPSIASSSVTIRRRVTSSRKFCATRCFT